MTVESLPLQAALSCQIWIPREQSRRQWLTGKRGDVGGKEGWGQIVAREGYWDGEGRWWCGDQGGRGGKGGEQ
jgi:hypothetical protein